ncbi:MAG TPA: amidohydrolase [Chloroflexaceae bacterium]|nr:amidohydrolase [Chloroflexaceae bacterium]
MPTLVLYNGPIYTFDPGQPVARALAIRDGRVFAVGTEGRVQAAVAGQRGETINLRGRAVVPGLTDAHVHIVFQGLTAREARLGEAASLDDALAVVAGRARDLPPGAWLRGWGWDHIPWGRRWPTRADLDAVCPDRPAMLTRKDGHSLWVNSRALALAGVTADTPDPAGGQIQRDRDGEPTGVLLESAMELVRAVVPPVTEEERLDALRAALAEALSYGITSVHIPPGTNHASGPEALRALQTLRARGQLAVRALAYLAQPDLEGALAMGLRSGLGDRWVRLGGLKLFADGSLGSESAEMLSHYEGRRHTGIATLPYEQLEDLVCRANMGGISVAVHAIGDAANRKVLDAIERARQAREQAGPDAPPLALPNRIEHVQVIHQKDLPRLAQLEVIASMQPIHCTSDIEAADALWGPRCALAYAWRSLKDSGATLAFGSDAPVETMNPWRGVHAAVTRQRPGGHPAGGWYPEQRLSAEEALLAYCVGPAIASGEAAEKGRLTVGALADMAVLTGDPLRSAPAELHAITAAMTIVEGKVAFERSS